MSIIAITVFVAGYALIASDRVSKTRVALTCAAIMVGAGIVGSDDVFYSHEAGIDWDVIFLLLGMMIIVSVLRHTASSNTSRFGPSNAQTPRRCAS